MTTARRICPLCESTCGLTLTMAGGRAVEVRGAADDLFSRGYLCPKGANLGALDADPDRLTAPLIRVGGRHVEAGWDEAFAAVREGLDGVRAAHGTGAFALYRGNPTAHTLAGVPYLRPLAAAMATPHQYSASTADQMPAHIAAGLVFGSPVAIGVPDLDRTDFLLMVGANPLASNGSLCTAPDFGGRLRALQARGGKLVVVDPRRTATARMADTHLAIRPGTDSQLLLGIARVLCGEGLVDLGAHGDRVHGLVELAELAGPFTPDAVAAACGLAADAVVSLARELAAAPSAAVYGRMGVTTAEHGTVASWLLIALNVLTGNLDRPGGLMFPRNPTRPTYLAEKPFRSGRWHSRVRGLPEVLGELPVATLAEEIATPGEGAIRALITVAGNPVLSAPNGDSLDAALPLLDFMVAVDPYLNETTRHADVILPPPRVLASGHYDWLLNAMAVRAVVRYSPPVLPVERGRPTEGQILARLAAIAGGEDTPEALERIGAALVHGLLAKAVAAPASPVFGRDPAELAALVTGEDDLERHLDVTVRLGPFGDGFGTDPDGITLAMLKAHPEGVDRGPMQPRLAEAIAHADGRVALCPPAVRSQVEALAAALARPWPEFVLIGRRSLRSNNSWMHNLPNLVGGPPRCTLLVNVDDADRLGFAGGQRIRLTSAVGSVVVPVETTDDIRPGVVSLPHGFGHDRPGSRLEVAARVAGVSANTLTDAAVLDVLSGNAVFNGVPVTLEALPTPALTSALELAESAPQRSRT
ncbi:MAG: molybdopterin-dependent oxidoreductase [Sporichthyaceae bacterium]